MAPPGHDPLEKPLSNSQIVLTSLCAGAIAGALAKTTIAPLDRTKINFQISNKPYSTRKALKFLVQTYREQGFLALWRGNSATMVRIVPHAAIQFTAHEQWKKILKVDNNKSPRRLFLAGSLAGATSQTLTYPLDVARARMAVTHKNEYATLRQVFYKILHEEGIAAFYKGYVPTIAGVVPYAGVSFFTYDTLKLVYRDYTKLDRNATLNPLISLSFGAVAGMLGQCSSYPLDIVRRRMQTDTQGQYKSIRATVKIIYKEGIIGGFYKGLSMNWIKGPIAVGISYSSYDNTRNLLRQLTVKCNNRKFL
ncbi:mitochondrial coenzyme A transporter SLC25A42-like [Zophobas morio]|uniref:mitochondrial coenzyme A transporter SLC25A42-like n=1 Tax=Zophobas morio TaxID=2755281 RepID=UPI0030835B37